MINVMKNLFILFFLFLILCCSCSNESLESVSDSESRSQPSSGTSESGEVSSDESKNKIGEIPGFGAIYQKNVSTNEMRKELVWGKDGALNTTKEVPAIEYWITDENGNALIDHPFYAVYFARNMPDWGGSNDTPKEYLNLPVVIGCYRGDFYRYYFVNGVFVLDAHDGYSCYDPRYDDVAFGYRLKYYYYDSCTPFYGLNDSKGNVLFEPVYTDIMIPFEDRFILGGGGFSPEERVFTLVDTDGNELAQFNNFIYNKTFGDSSYIGIAHSNGDEYEWLSKCYDENGNVRESGFWFVDKNGKILSPRFNEIKDYYGIISPSDILSATDEDGNAVEIKVSDYLCKP